MSDWPQLVHDVALASAIIDRLVHRGQVFYLKGPSWRTKDRGLAGDAAPANEADGGPNG